MQVTSQWYGIDFAKVSGPSGRSLVSKGGNDLRNFYSWGEAVVSPVSGTIVAIENSLPDNPIGTHDTKHPLGNHVVIKTNDGDYVFLAHFQKDSVKVSQGDLVHTGDHLGKCGNSGNSDYPHIHLHTQNTPDFTNGQGKNMIFSNISVELSGKKFERVDWPLIRGLFVSQNHEKP
jgi:murein DD-endopeptidase MepM/ murein hydrolase activator NlpD